jgi:exodeoxyribonuclease VII large subunit
VDFTIADFVADLRAPTPSAAAELVVPDSAETCRHLAQLTTKIRRRVVIEVEQLRNQLEYLKRSALFREPAQRLAQARQRLDLAQEALQRAVQSSLEDRRRALIDIAASLRHHRPDQVLAFSRQRLAVLSRRFAEGGQRAVAARQHRFEKAATMLRLLSPEATLGRGYSITTLESGEMLRSVAKAEPGARIITKVRDGKFASTVTADPAPLKKPRASKPKPSAA